MYTEFYGRLSGAFQKSVVGLSLALTFALAAASNADADSDLTKLLPKAIQESGVLRVVANTETPPMIYVGEDGKTLEGLEPELTNALAQVLGVKIQYTNVKFDSLIASIKAGRADVAFGSLGDLKKRQEQVDFVDYVKVGHALIVPAGNPLKVKANSDLCGHSVSAVRGTYQVTLLSKANDECKAGGKAEIQVQVFTDTNEALLSLKAGRSDSWLADSGPGAYIAKQSNGQFEVAFPPKVIALFGYAVNKDQTQLRDALKAGLEELVKNGTYKAICEKWGQEGTMVDEITVNNALL
jgi:polar amino acid transport system substrate-binding protein